MQKTQRVAKWPILSLEAEFMLKYITADSKEAVFVYIATAIATAQHEPRNYCGLK